MADLVELKQIRPGDHWFLTCACGKEELLVVAVHDEAGAFITALVCAECDNEIPISFGQPPANSGK